MKLTDIIAQTLCDLQRLYGTHVPFGVLAYEIGRKIKVHSPDFDMAHFLNAAHCTREVGISADPNAWDVV